jgi:hypothetical protein
MNKAKKELVIVNGSPNTAEVITKGGYQNCLVISDVYMEKLGSLKLYFLVSNTMKEKEAMQILNAIWTKDKENKFMAWIPVDAIHNLSTLHNLNLSEDETQSFLLFTTKSLGFQSIWMQSLGKSLESNENKGFSEIIRTTLKELIVSTNTRIH